MCEGDREEVRRRLCEFAVHREGRKLGRDGANDDGWIKQIAEADVEAEVGANKPK